MRIQLPILLLVSLLSGCVVTADGRATDSQSFVLSERVDETGVTTRYRVQPDRQIGPSIVRTETVSVEIAYLGVSVRTLDRPYADALGVEPWRGVALTIVQGDSAAKQSGLRAGDVLVTLGGELLSSAEQFKDVVATQLAPGVPVEATILQKGDDRAHAEISVEIVPGTRTIDDSTSERIALAAPEEIVKRTGMQVATVEAELAREIGVGDDDVALVTTVVPGAPAYDEGIRGGDRILECNGAPVSRAEDLVELLRSGAGRLDVLVDGSLGAHRADVGARGNVDVRRRFHIPILVDYSRRVDRTRTSFLDFIFQFGFNYRRTAYGSSTREPYEKTYLSILPFGMFEFERSPDESRNTLFWFITWSTRR